MNMKTIIVLGIAACLIIPGCFLICCQNIQERVTDTPENIFPSQDKSEPYTNHIEFSQDILQLNHEVVQFEITFHQDDIIDVSVNMFVSYVDETITAVYCLLTDGTQPLLEPINLWFVPERKYLLVTPNIRVSLGRFWLVNIINKREGRLQIGSTGNDSGRFDVRAGDRWYLTLAAPASSEKSGYSVLLTAQKSSMEVAQLTRHTNVGFYAATFNQFSGAYYALKVSLLGGVSLCRVTKDITTHDGSIVNIYAAGQRRGTMFIHPPDGDEIRISNKKLMHYGHLGNETGTWGVVVKGWSLYFVMSVVLCYIDIDPHGRYTT
jgi:hypothetical protein